MLRLYQSPLVQTVRRLKFLSIATCASAVGASPFLWLLTEQGTSVGARVAAISVVLGTGVGSTALLNYFLKPYVLSVDLQSAENIDSWTPKQLQSCQVKLTTLDLFNRPKEHTLRIADLRKPDQVTRPMVNLIAQSSADSKKSAYFYIHEDAIVEQQQNASDKLWVAMQRDAASF